MEKLESLFNLWLPSPLQPFRTPETDKIDLQVYIKRDDLIHYHISGNKYRKLKGHFNAFMAGNFQEIVAFGGAFSNLLYSLSFITGKTEIPTTFYVRGDGYDPNNPSLEVLKKNGVKLRFIDRRTYREKDKPPVLEQLLRVHKRPYVIPEGGSDPRAVPGSAEIWHEIKEQLERLPDYLVMDLGTGGTFGGVMKVIDPKTRLIGIPVLKGVNWEKTLSPIVEKNFESGLGEGIDLLQNYHFGGFAKYNEKLIAFINTFRRDYGIPLDPIYTGKLAYAVVELIKKGYFKPGSMVVWVHSGGLQGIAGFNYRFGHLIGH